MEESKRLEENELEEKILEELDNSEELQKLADEEDLQVYLVENLNGEKIIGVLQDEHEYLLSSRYEEDRLIDDWCAQKEINSYQSIAVVFGMANGQYLRALRRKNKDMVIIGYEPSYSIAYLNKTELGVEDFLQDEKMYIHIGKKGVLGVYGFLARIVGYESVKHTFFMVSPNYENIFKDTLTEVRGIFDECVQRIYFNRNTISMLGHEMTSNIAANIVDYVEQYALTDLVHIFEKVDKNHVPAIIVSAGPSLDKNIHELKRIHGNAFIIAVDTALNSLARAGILPDIAVTVDPHKPLSLFEHPNMRNVPLVFALTANAEIKGVHEGIRIYQDGSESWLDSYLSRFNKERIGLETGGSVANDAFSLAQRLGFSTVIFIGQDLAYPNNQEHSKDAYGSLVDNDINNTGKTYIEIEDIYGGKVKTEYNMNMYRMWFERATEVYEDIKFIDATEGGAKINGMEIMTLSDAIDRECCTENKVDFQSIMSSLTKRFSNDEKKLIYDDLIHFEERMDCIENKIKKGIEVYDKLEELNTKKYYQGKDFEDCIEAVTQINNWASNDEEVKYFSLYVAKEDFAVRECIYDNKESISDEIALIVKHGRDMLNAMLNAVKAIVEDMQCATEDVRKMQ